MDLGVSHLVAFLVGALTGAAGQYLGDKYSDRRREKEAARRTLKSFRQIAAKMPALLREMRDDLLNDSTDTVREFFVLPNKRVSLGGSTKRRFTYFESEHEGLREKLDLLEQEGFIVDVTPNNTPLYRMNEHFVSFLRTELKAS